MSPDPMNVSGFSNPDNPQSWNGYSYTLNNPETLTDPTGLCGGSGEYPNLPCPDITSITVTASDNSFGPGNLLWWAYVESHFSPAAFPPMVYRSGPLPLPPTQPQSQTCTVNAHGVENNLPTRAPNRKGAYGVPETPGTAVIDRSQWLPPGSSSWTPAQDNAYINNYRLRISGYVPNGSGGYVQVFNGVSDNMGPASSVTLLENAYPHRVLFELPGGQDLGNVNGMRFHIPPAMGCPHP
jgi:hypothetical protein